MEDRESSVASSADFYGTEESPISHPNDALDVNTNGVAKRKAEDLLCDQEKKRKLDSLPSPLLSSISSDLRPCARLPPSVWQHIFLSCSLADLGRLIQVNRSFLSYLTDVRNVSTSRPDPGCVRLLKSESLWASARNALPTKPPRPLPGFTELQMWQLAWSKRCQFCEKLNSFVPGERIWQKGPGTNGVRTIWPFAIRACGPCLLDRCQTDTSLLFSSASALRPALPFALLTKDHNYITAYTLQSATTPADVEIVKYYYRGHVEDIRLELSQVMARGDAAAEEWSKGLDARGKERMRAAENWERWEVKYQWWEQHQGPRRATSAAPSLATTSHKEPSKSPARQMPSPVIHAPVPATPSTHYGQGRPPTAPPQIFTPQPFHSGSTATPQRNLHDAIEAKANRKADIEQRCQQLRPAIPPNILRHMDSFKAALQISQPMTDDAWNVLEPRLLAQLPAAQQAELDHVSRVASLPIKPSDRRHQDINNKEAKELMDREWEESQRPVRDKLSAIADDFINRDWDHGNAVTHDNSPKFSADLLIHVRRRFYADVAQDTAATLGQQDLTTDADTKPKLVLDDMKWVYDNKLKPLTEQFRKDIFLCNGSDCDRNTRFYGFEGVIQHFGARHTNAFSSGNVVVAWREAEWPEEPPFHLDPISVKHAYHAASNSASYGNHYGGYSRAGTSTPHMQPHLPQASPGPYQYGGQYNGPFPPPQAPPGALPGFGFPQPYTNPADNYSYQTMGASGYGIQPGHNSYMPSPAMIHSAVAPPPAMPPPSQGVLEPVPNGTGDGGHSTSAFDKQVSSVIKMAQELWKQTKGIKDMPNSLRIYVLLHRIISKFHVEFNHEPNLNHFVAAFSNHEIPKALKNAPGLSCKTCQAETLHHLPGAYYSKPEERRTYIVLNLLSHFKTQHLSAQPPGQSVPAQQTVPLDWKEDMIELPSERIISGLIHAPGMDDEKLLMIATVFPSYFPMPLPKIGVIDSNGVASPASSGSKDAKEGSLLTDAPGDTSDSSAVAPGLNGSILPPKPMEDEYDPLRPALSGQASEISHSTHKKQTLRDSPSAERRQRHHPETQYYVGRSYDSAERMVGANKAFNQMSREPMDDGYARPRGYVEYGPSPRMIQARPAYDEYTGRRTVFREQERFYGPPSEDYVYTHRPESSHGREYREIRYYDEDEQQPEYRFVREARSPEATPTQAQSAADRFLEEFDAEPTSTNGTTQSQLPSRPDTNLSASGRPTDDGTQFTTPLSNIPTVNEPESQRRPFPAPHPKAPSTVSNGSRYEEHRGNGRYIPSPDTLGPPRRVGPQRRRDRPAEHRMPSRYYRYMSVARDEPYGRGPSMSRSQSRRYEEQRRRIDQQETPQPNADRDYEPAYSRDASIDQTSPEDGYYPHSRQQQREYVSVQDRLYPHSPPPRYRYNDTRASQPVYVDQWGQPMHEYEIIRVPRDARQSRGAAYHPQPRYDTEQYQYVPVPYEGAGSQRYEQRPAEYIYYEEDREREGDRGERERERGSSRVLREAEGQRQPQASSGSSRPLVRRPIVGNEGDADIYEASSGGPEIKVEGGTGDKALGDAGAGVLG